jgi:hypothetical protein
MRFIATAFAFLILTAAPSYAQWLHHPTPGVPRASDGQVDLDAAPPRTADGEPDLSGIWGWQPGQYQGALAVALKPEEIQQWARTLQAQRIENMGRDDPANFTCIPQGPRLNLYAPIMAKIVQTPTLMLILSEDLTYRQIFLDGRGLPVDPDPSFMGYSVGRWDGDTLVVETIGFKDRTWLDFSGLPHSEALRVTERFRRDRLGHLSIEETIDDPQVFARPFTVQLGARFVPDTELLEFICAENEKSHQHMVGKTSEEISKVERQKVTVAPEILAKYVGTYDLRFPENPTTPMLIPISMKEDVLTIGGAPLVPISPTKFAGPFGQMEVVTDAAGKAIYLLVRVVEGDLKALRVPDPTP